MKVLITIYIVAVSLLVQAQNPKGFDKMCKNYIAGTVMLAMPEQLQKDSNAVILDARELKEYNISHIAGARYVGYDNFVLHKVNAISKKQPIYVYCSIGYRSEKIGEKLQKAGFVNVYNLYGGIFNWKNSGYPIVNNNNEFINVVHGYNKEWSKWVSKASAVEVVIE